MGFYCKRKKSKSKRKNVDCRGCKWLCKIAYPDGQKKWRCTC